MTDLGLYIHTPFCRKKCNYCDFYSFPDADGKREAYTNRVIEEIKQWGARSMRPVVSLYLGGGTPTLLGADNIVKILSAVKENFCLQSPEITLEANPGDDLSDLFCKVKSAGVNRLSIGVQSALSGELAVLGRRHTAEDAEKTVRDARAAGFENISLDLMIGLPESTCDTVKKSVEYIISLNPEHVSAYILKIEEGTPFYKNPPPIPNEDQIAEQYLFAAELLEKAGYMQYEISNFAKRGFESRHNMRYWDCREYIGIGPSAHSFFEGERFYYKRDYNAFMNKEDPIPDGKGGDRDEYIMLRLRLKNGVIIKEYLDRYGELPKGFIPAAKRLEKGGLATVTDKNIALTKKGFLVSNAIIGELLQYEEL